MEAQEGINNQNSSDPELETSQESSFSQPLVVVDKKDNMKSRTTSSMSPSQVKHLYKWYHINWEMVPSKIAYFLDKARRLCYTPFLIIFFTSIGLSKVEAGIILGFR